MKEERSELFRLCSAMPDFDEEIFNSEFRYLYYAGLINDIIALYHQSSMGGKNDGNSWILYWLGITTEKPTGDFSLITFSSSRVTLPDHDLDFEDVRREEIINYLIEKYGEDRVAQVVTFGHMKPRMVVRDVGRALGIPINDVDILAKKILNTPGKPITIENSLDKNSEYYSPDLLKAYEDDSVAKEILDLGKQLENTVRQSGVHAAAVIISDKPLVHYSPLMTAKSSVTKYIAQFDYPTLESLGLLKIDCLGLATLSIINKACELINKRHNLSLTPETIPYEEQSGFELLAAGETVGVFQVESHGLRKTLIQMKPTKFSHIMDVISLYRPGPLQYIPSYIARMHGNETVEYRHPLLERVLANTQGIMIYQEQINRVLVELAGYTLGEADLVRKGISKKKPEVIDENRKKFVDGCKSKNGIDEETATSIYHDIEKFALYGFNRSHAASYARITMITAWLKANYPLEYILASLIIEGSKQEKVINYVGEARRMGIQVLPPDVNESEYGFTIVSGDYSQTHIDPKSKFVYRIDDYEVIRFGLGSIKNVGDSVANSIVNTRTIKTLPEISALELENINKRAMYSLVAAGVFDSIDSNRGKLLSNIDTIVEQAKKLRKVVIGGQKSLYTPTIFLPETYTITDIAQAERDALGFWLKYHPTAQNELHTVVNTTYDIGEDNVNNEVTVYVAIEELKEVYTKKGDKIGFAVISDQYGQAQAIYFAKAFEQAKPKEGDVVLLKGFVRSTNGDTPTLIVDRSVKNPVHGKIMEKKEQKPEERIEEPAKEKKIVGGRFKLDTNVSLDDIENLIKPYMVESGSVVTILLYNEGTPAGKLKFKNAGISEEDAHGLGMIRL